MRLELGCSVHCLDAPYGVLDDVIIDPISRRVTHVVVQPENRHDRARLAPIERAHAADSGIAVDYSVADLERLERVQESAYLRLGRFPVADPDWEVGVEEVLGLPLYQDLDGMGTVIEPDPHVVVNYDRIPRDEIEIRRASAVISADGHHLGHVEGFLVGEDAMVGDLVLERGQLWRRREVVIPYGAVAQIKTDSVTLSLSKDQVGELASRRVHRWH
jgi:sporulation protein YlmC with PRC-barrel domain